MIIVLKANRSEEQVKNFISNLTDRYDVSVNTWVGTHSTVLGLIGDTAAIDSEYIAAQDIVESVKRVQEPYKKANRKFHPQDTMVDCGGVTIRTRALEYLKTFVDQKLLAPKALPPVMQSLFAEAG